MPVKFPGEGGGGGGMNRFQTKLTESQIFLGVGDQIEPSFLKKGSQC